MQNHSSLRTDKASEQQRGRTIIGRFIRRLLGDKRGNALMIMGFSLIPLTFATGMVVDYSGAARLQTKLNSAADAAALAAVSQEMMKQDNAAAKALAEKMFETQITGLPGLVYVPGSVDVKITGNNSATTTRTAVVTFHAKSTNSFSGVLGMGSINIGGISKSTATAAPNIDFYLALDTSPSMALPTTTSGFSVMDNAVKCAFACHSNKIELYVGNSIPSLILDNDKFKIVKADFGFSYVGTDKVLKIDGKGSYIFNSKKATDSKCAGNGNADICVYNADGTYADSYWYAINQGVRLRVTDERIAAGDLMTLAQSYAAANSRTYRAALYTFDHSTDLKKIFPAAGIYPGLSSDLAAVGTAASLIEPVTVNDRAGNGRSPSNESGTEYLFTSFKSILDRMTADMPLVSGKGSNDPLDTPQAFMFMVTDGMSDENIGSGRTRAAMQTAQLAQCDAIKKRGIKIAILYTEYTVASIQDDEPGQRELARKAIQDNPTIASRLTSCASDGLMYTVSTDQSISAALQALFTKAVATARLQM